MANQKHLDILKQGVKTWNGWAKDHPYTVPDLSCANLSGANLNGAYFYGAILSGANLKSADLRSADLRSADLIGTSFADAHLDGAYLDDADLASANLSRADLTGSQLSRANFSFANLNRANLSGANLNGANFSFVNVGWTRFGDVDLSTVKGIESVSHTGPSTIGIDTVYRSKGDIPEGFLKGAGVDDTFITYIRSLVGKGIEYYSCFISHSSKDDAFAKRLYADLQGHDVRCWFAPEDLKIGEKFWQRIDESIRLYDKLLVVLSQHSVESDWVEREVMAALEKEQQQKRLVLFPIALDEAFEQTSTAWAADIRRSRHIGLFYLPKTKEEQKKLEYLPKTKEEQKKLEEEQKAIVYPQAFNRLLRDLKAEAQKMG